MKKKTDRVTLPVTALPQDMIEQVEKIADASMISRTAVLRQAIMNLIDQPEDQISEYVSKDYGKSVPFVNIYCPPQTAVDLDALAEKFDVPRNQVIRAAVGKYLSTIGN